MILLTTTSDELRATTDDAATLDVHVSWADLFSNVVTPGRTNTAISSATTTAIGPSPGASTSRTIKVVCIRNRHATGNVRVTIAHYDGSITAELFSARLYPGDAMKYEERRGWYVTERKTGSVSTVEDRVATTPTVNATYTSTLLTDIVNDSVTVDVAYAVQEHGIPVTSGVTYYYRWVLPYTAAATTTGSRWLFTGMAWLNAPYYRADYSLTTTSRTTNDGLSFDTGTLSASSAATAANICIMEGFITPLTGGRDGSINYRFSSEISGSAITLKAGAILHWQRVL